MLMKNGIFRFALLVFVAVVLPCLSVRAAAQTAAPQQNLDVDCVKLTNGGALKGLQMGDGDTLLSAYVSNDRQHFYLSTTRDMVKGKLKSGSNARLYAYSSATGGNPLWTRYYLPKKTNISPVNSALMIRHRGYARLSGASTDTIEICDPETGKANASIPLIPIYYNDSLDIMLGIRDGEHVEELFAYAMSDGTLLWSNPDCPPVTAWTAVGALDGEKIVAVADKLYVIDMETGKIAKKKISLPGLSSGGKFLSIGLSLLSFALGALAGSALAGGHAYYGPYFYTSASSAPYLTLRSGLYADGNRFYVSDSQNAYCFDSALNQIWQTTLDAPGSLAMIGKGGDTLTIFGLGYRKKGTSSDTDSEVGRPFYMEIDARDGKRLYGQVYSQTKAAVRDVVMDDLRPKAVLLDNVLALTDDNGGLDRVEYPEETYGKLCKILKDSVFRMNKSGNGLQPCNADGGFMLSSENGKVYFTDSYGAVKETLDGADIYEVCSEDSTLMLMQSEGKKPEFCFADGKMRMLAKACGEVKSVIPFGEGFIILLENDCLYLEKRQLAAVGK